MPRFRICFTPKIYWAGPRALRTTYSRLLLPAPIQLLPAPSKQPKFRKCPHVKILILDLPESISGKIHNRNPFPVNYITGMLFRIVTETVSV